MKALPVPPVFQAQMPPGALGLAFACVCPGSPSAGLCSACGHCIPEGGQDVEMEWAWAVSQGCSRWRRLCCDWGSQSPPGTSQQQ